MIQGKTIVVDIGKTNAKVSLWNSDAQMVERHVRANEPQQSPSGYQSLDVAGIDGWLLESISAFARLGPVARIVTVGHGAAAVLIKNDELYLDPMDYEDDVSSEERSEYSAMRDPFLKTGSPLLPVGLNLGIQLHRLEQMAGKIADDVLILPWPQYWSWRFCGVPASEVSSLGCHTDLWRPTHRAFSEMAINRGWAERMAPLRQAGDVLGPITAEVVAQTGLNPDCVVLCGMHDSNAALLAARGHSVISTGDATVLSTGTWFVAMRSLADGEEVDLSNFEEARDCLVNVDVFGQPTPSARFMGGREVERIAGIDSFALTDGIEADEFLRRLPALIRKYQPAIPSFVQGVGPFPASAGDWPDRPDDPIDERVLTHLYLALMANTSLDLIGSRDRLLIEGRFAEDPVFVRALASLRPQQNIYTSNAEHDVAFGALRLVDPNLALATELTPVDPLEFDFGDYALDWQRRAEAAQENA